MPNVLDCDSSSSGITPAFPVRPDGTELEYFEAFFDHEIMNKIMRQTVKMTTSWSSGGTQVGKIHHHTELITWVNTSQGTFFFSLITLIPHSKKYIISDYWKKTRFLVHLCLASTRVGTGFRLFSALYILLVMNSLDLQEDKRWVHDAQTTIQSFPQTTL